MRFGNLVLLRQSREVVVFERTKIFGQIMIGFGEEMVKGEEEEGWREE